MEKLRYETFRHIEAELYSYHKTLQEIDNLRGDIINASDPLDTTGIRGTKPTDPTGKTASLLVTHRLIQRMSEMTNAISQVYGSLPPEKQQFIKIKYWEHPQWSYQRASMELHSSVTSLYRWRESIIYSIASILGWK